MFMFKVECAGGATLMLLFRPLNGVGFLLTVSPLQPIACTSHSTSKTPTAYEIVHLALCLGSHKPVKSVRT